MLRRAERYAAECGSFALSTITVMEIVKGLHKERREDQIRRFLDGCTSVELLTLDLNSAELAGRIYGDLERLGQTIGRLDPMIAALALQHRLVLVSGNLVHFRRIQELGYALKLDNWRLPAS